MKPPVFEFSAPTHLSGVLERLAHYGDEGRVLAGGQSLVPLLNMRMASPRGLVSINHCDELSYIRVVDGCLTIGALTRQQEANTSELVKSACPLLAAVLPEVGCRASRNRSTICGSLAHADPCAELPAVAVALDAMFVVRSQQGMREIDAAEFFVSELCNSMEPGEMLEAVRLPVAKADSRVAFSKISSRGHGFALAAVATQLDIAADGTCTSARIAAVGGGATPIRLVDAEQTLIGRRVSEDAARAAADAALPMLDPSSDLHADSGYRRRVIGKMVRQTLCQAAGV
ncbi:MAG: FAD binding domain-containing protein [Rhizobiales bacterium]|nr:FAD binding domain-containing protein [Hyphomicrobiales bacterium]